MSSRFLFFRIVPQGINEIGISRIQFLQTSIGQLVGKAVIFAKPDGVNNPEVRKSHLATQLQSLAELVFIVLKRDEMPLTDCSGFKVGLCIPHNLVESSVYPIQVIGVVKTVDVKLDQGLGTLKQFP